MKKRFTEEQIIDVLKEADVDGKPAERCRKHWISEATYDTTGRQSLAA